MLSVNPPPPLSRPPCSHAYLGFKLLRPGRHARGAPSIHGPGRVSVCAPSGTRSVSTARRGTAIAARTLSLPRSSTAKASPKAPHAPDALWASRARAASVSDSLDLSGLVRPLGNSFDLSGTRSTSRDSFDLSELEPLDAPNRSASLRRVVCPLGLR